MGLGTLPVWLVFNDINASLWHWGLIISVCVLWPHLAMFRAVRSDHGIRAEIEHLLIDSFFVGAITAVIEFNALPSLLLIVITLADRFHTGIENLWKKSVPLIVMGALVVSAINGFAWSPDTSIPVMYACLPFLVFHTIIVARNSYHMIRYIKRQNKKLTILSQTDDLTGLSNRRHWQRTATDHLATNEAGTLLLIDIDDFKQINDSYGHATGDDVLKSMGHLLLQHVGTSGHSCRLGGDEFAVVLPESLDEAVGITSQIQNDIKKLRWPQAPELRITTSMGLADHCEANGEFRQWYETADHNLYHVKSSGKDGIFYKQNM